MGLEVLQQHHERILITVQILIGFPWVLCQPLCDEQSVGLLLSDPLCVSGGEGIIVEKEPVVL